eukprot:gene10155-11192_t
MEVQQQDELAELLINSLKRKEVKKASKALEMGADPNYIGPEGFAAIHLAAGLDGCKGEQLLNLILRYGGNPNLKSLENETALHVAVMWNREYSTRVLLEHGADPTLKNADGYTAFQFAANSSDHEFKCLEILKSSYNNDSSENEAFVPRFQNREISTSSIHCKYDKTQSANYNEKRSSLNYEDISISPNYKDTSSVAASVSESEHFDSFDELFTGDTDADSSTSYFSLPKHSLRGLITELKEGDPHNIMQKVITGEASIIVGSEFEPRISFGEIPMSLIKNTNEAIILDQLRQRSQRKSISSPEGVLLRKKKLSQRQEQKLKRTPKSVKVTEEAVDEVSPLKPRLFGSPFPLIQRPQLAGIEKQDERQDVKATSSGTPKKFFDAPIVEGKPFLIIPSSINSFHSAESHEPPSRNVNFESAGAVSKQPEASYFNFPSASTAHSSNDAVNRTTSNEENPGNSKPSSTNEETESEFPIMQRMHSPRSLYAEMNYDSASRNLRFVDQSTTMHTDVRNYVDKKTPFDLQDKAVQINDVRTVKNQQDMHKSQVSFKGFGQSSDAFSADNELVSNVESDGSSSGYGGDISQFSSPDDVVTGLVKFDLRNSPSVTVRNKSKKKASSTESSEGQVERKLKNRREFEEVKQNGEDADLPTSPRKRLNAATSSDEEEQEEKIATDSKKRGSRIDNKKGMKSYSQKVRDNVDHTFGDKTSLNSPSAEDLRSFHRAKLNKQHHVGNWKGNCECELCMTKRASLPPSPALPFCAHERCVNDEDDTFKEVTIDYDWKDVSLLESTDTEHAVVVPDEMHLLSLEEIKERLIKAGERPGPITNATKNIYLKQLVKIEAGLLQRNDDSVFLDYMPELRDELKELSTNDFSYLEDEMSTEFENPQKHKWREGTQKTSFNYVLLDPRVTVNLRGRSQYLTDAEIFRCFVRSVFYVGKGKESRPYGHLHEAIKMKKLNEQGTKISDKLKMILNIWQSGFGVVSLHLFHSIIPVEAYTREACMIDVLGLTRLTNLKKGEYYGSASSWNSKKKRQLGVHLLKKALKIFLVEGEKQIREKDL